MLLDGKVAVVTGSGTGLGRAYAMGLAKAGAKVVVNARTANNVAKVVDEIRKMGGTAEGCAVSVASMAGAREIIQTAVDGFGRIDILVNNAGITARKLLADMTEQDFDDVIATNLKGTFACTRHAVPHMMKQGWGRIINVSSGSIIGQEGNTSYASSKGGVLSISLTWAVELAQYGIRVNCVSPGSIDTTRAAHRPPRKGAAGRIPLGRHGAPEEIAAAVRFVCSPGASFITGQTLHVNGGEKMYF